MYTGSSLCKAIYTVQIDRLEGAVRDCSNLVHDESFSLNSIDVIVILDLSRFF